MWRNVRGTDVCFIGLGRFLVGWLVFKLQSLPQSHPLVEMEKLLLDLLFALLGVRTLVKDSFSDKSKKIS